MRLEDKGKDKAALTMQVSRSSTRACPASFACGAGDPFTCTAVATVLVCTAISQDPLNLHEKTHNYVILYLQIAYQPTFLSSYILKHQDTRIALKRFLVLINICSLLLSLPVFTERELSSQLPRCGHIQCCTLTLYSANLTKNLRADPRLSLQSVHTPHAHTRHL